MVEDGEEILEELLKKSEEHEDAETVMGEDQVKEDLLLNLLEETLEEQQHEAHKTGTEEIEASREEVRGQKEGDEHETGNGEEGVLEYSVGPITYIVGEEGYRVVEPNLDPEVARIVDAVAEYLARRGLPALSALEAAEKLGLSQVAQRQLEAFMYHVEKRLSPWGFLYPLVLDRRLEDISVAGGTLRVRHREIVSREYIPVKGIEVPGEQELREYVQRLASAYGAAVSPAFPIAEFEAEGRRVTIVLGSIASSTSISIRIHPERPLALEELIESGTISREAAEYLLEVLRSRGTVFVVGYQGSGKTTLVNALLDELPEDWKIVVIEDVPEIRLVKHRHWVSLRTRRARSLAASRETEITYRDLIRTALRLGGQVTTMTEARGEEVRELLEVAALGEAVVATFHARDWRELRQRLELLGIGKEYLSLLWAVVIMGKVRLRNGDMARRVLAIYEVLPDATEHMVFRYSVEEDELVMVEPPRRIAFSQPSLEGGDRDGKGSDNPGQENHNAIPAGRDGSLDGTDNSGSGSMEEPSRTS